jgi:two-component system, sensor histidine kinase PdtaS
MNAITETFHEAEARFRTMADHAPVLLWMAGTDALCDFFNQGWLSFTGRSMQQEFGNGWVEGVHPEDFQRCMHTYLDAFVARQPFSMEYRLRRHDGEYRWVYDQGAPRFENGTFAGFIGSCVDITEQRLARETLSRLNGELEDQVRERTAIAREREVLLREVHHRVKNDLQLVSSLLSMQARRLSDEESIEALADCQARVETIALIHEHMYQSDTLARVPFAKNVRSLAANLFRAASLPQGSVELSVDVDEDIILSVDRAIPCGLILNELVTNALKHAFPEGRPGTVHVTFKRDDARRVALTVKDDGVGTSHSAKAESLGSRLVSAFAEQLHAEVKRDNGVGTSVKISFQYDEPK